MIEAGKARSLAIMAPERNPTFPNIPTLKEEMGIDYSTGAWRGFVGPPKLAADVQVKLVAALKKVYESKEYNEFMSGRGFGVKWADAQGFASFMNAGDEQMGQAMKAAGLAKS
jgi:tripartite-type tricarboxylate transporter receptor subunit TctC